MAQNPTLQKYPINAALEAAVIAHADDDTPRLVYADWLDENGDPDRAAFIRTQVSLWDKNPADPGYVDLIERKRELLPALGQRFLNRVNTSKLIFGGYQSADEGDDQYAVWHRGFPFFHCDPNYYGPRKQPAADPQLAKRVRETTIRGIGVEDYPPGSLSEFLALPEAKLLSCLWVGNSPAPGARSESLATVLASGALLQLQWLVVDQLVDPAEFTALGKSAPWECLRRFTCREMFSGSPGAVRIALAGSWCAQLRRVTVGNVLAPSGAAFLEGLATLPHLHTLEVNYFTGTGRVALETATFPAVAQLRLNCHDTPASFAESLAKSKFPQLIWLDLRGAEFQDDHISQLCRSPLFAHLQVLALNSQYLHTKSLAAIAESQSAKTLRILELPGPSYGPEHLAAVAKPGVFPKLTTLGLGCGKLRLSDEVNTKLASLFEAAEMPDLRRLDLTHWPIGDVSACAIAGNPSFANLRALSIRETGVKARGIAAIVSSPHLQNLVNLCLLGCYGSTALEALRDPAVLPHLAYCRLPESTPEDLKRKLDDARPGVFA